MTDFRIHAASLGGTALPGCSGYAAEVGRSVSAFATSGAAHRRLIAAGRYAKAVSITTSGLFTMLSKLGLPAAVPVPCTSVISHLGGLILAASAQDPILPADTAGAAELMTITNGLLCLRGISWSQPGEACVCDVGVWPLSTDGQEDAWALSQGAIPALPASEEDYDLHAATWKGVALDGMTGLQLAIATNPQVEFNPGSIYPTMIRQAPATGPIEVSASFTLPDRAALRAYGQHFHGGVVGPLVLTFRRFSNAAARDAVNPVVITLTGAAEVSQAQDGRPGSVSVTVHGVKTDGTSPLAW